MKINKTRFSKPLRVKTHSILEFKLCLAAVFFTLHLNIFPYRFFGNATLERKHI